MGRSPHQAQDALTDEAVQEAVGDLTSAIEELTREIGSMLITLDRLGEAIMSLTDTLTEDRWKPVLTRSHPEE